MDVQTVDIVVEVLNAAEAIAASAFTNLLSLKLYVRSCYSDACSESARYPAPYHCDATGNGDCSAPAPLVIDGPVSASTNTRLLFRLDESADAWCPVSATTNGACLYSIGLFTDLSVSGVDGARDNGGVVFRIEYSSSAGMETVAGEAILGTMLPLDVFTLSPSTPSKMLVVTPFATNHFAATNPTDLFVLRVEACAGTVGLYGCGNSGALAPASYSKVRSSFLLFAALGRLFFCLRQSFFCLLIHSFVCSSISSYLYSKVANRVLGGGFTGFTARELELATWPCAVGGETSACGTALHGACVAKCEASTPPCHAFSVEYKSAGGITFGAPTPCRVCNAANGDACPAHEMAWVGGVGAALYSTSGCVGCLLCTVTFYANLAHNLTRSP
jgi:hypothetical protein